MKGTILTLLVFTSLSASTIHAMGRKLPEIKDETINDVVVQKDFNLYATDGSVLRFLSNSTIGKLTSALLPPEKNADHRLCSKNDFDLFTKLTNIGITLSQAPRSLTASEVALIQKTPRCAPYDTALNLVAAALLQNQSVDFGNKLTSLSLRADKKSGAYLQLSTDNKKTAEFRVSSDLEGIKDTHDLTLLKVLPQESGQGLGLSFNIKDVDTQDPTYSSREESCIYNREVRKCIYDKNSRHDSCEYITISEPGRRRIDSTNRSTFYTLEFNIFDMQNRSLLKGTVMDVNFDSNDRNGLCYPARGRD